MAAIAQEATGTRDPGDPHSPALTAAEYALISSPDPNTTYYIS